MIGETMHDVIDPPMYHGFRIQEGGMLLAVITRVDSRDQHGSYWGYWFSERTPNGVRRQVPVTTTLYGLDDVTANEAIESIRNGLPPSSELADKLPIFHGAEWTYFEPKL